MKKTQVEGHLVSYYCPYCGWSYLGDLTKRFLKIRKCTGCGFILLLEILLKDTRAKFINNLTPT